MLKVLSVAPINRLKRSTTRDW